MTHLESAINTIVAALDTTDSDLQYVRSRLDNEFDRVYAARAPDSASSAYLNPVRLLAQLHALQRGIPETADALLGLLNEKREFVRACRKYLPPAHAAAVSYLPVAAPNVPAEFDGDDDGQLSRDLEDDLDRAARQLDPLLARFEQAHRGFITAFAKGANDFSASDLDLALMKAGLSSDAGDASPVVAAVAPVGATTKTKGPAAAKGAPGGADTGAGKGKENTSQTQDPGPHAVATKEAVSFTPVSKAAYNRLPRNLKIRAGKLAEINELYERVFNVLQNSTKPMPDTELIAASGAESIERIEVLRGLAVLHRSEKGWELSVKRQTQRRPKLRQK